MFFKDELNFIRAFLGGVAFGYLANTGRKKAKRKSARKNQRAYQDFRFPSFHPVACLGVSKTLKISTSKAHKLKQLAIDMEYINVKPQYIKIKGLKPSQIKQFARANPEKKTS